MCAEDEFGGKYTKGPQIICVQRMLFKLRDTCLIFMLRMMAFKRRAFLFKLTVSAIALCYSASAFASCSEQYRSHPPHNQGRFRYHKSFGIRSTFKYLSREEANTSRNKNEDKKFVLGAAFVSGLAAVAGAAKFGFLNGAWDVSQGNYGIYTDSMILRDCGSTVLTAGLGYALVKILTYGYQKEIYGAKTARKLIHTLSAPLFVVFWPIFSEADGARFFASIVASPSPTAILLKATTPIILDLQNNKMQACKMQT